MLRKHCFLLDTHYLKVYLCKGKNRKRVASMLTMLEFFFVYSTIKKHYK